MNVATRVMENITAAAIAATSPMETIIAAATADIKAMENITAKAKMVLIRRHQKAKLRRHAATSQMGSITVAPIADTKAMENTIVVKTAATRVTESIIAREIEAISVMASTINDHFLTASPKQHDVPSLHILQNISATY